MRLADELILKSRLELSAANEKVKALMNCKA